MDIIKYKNEFDKKNYNRTVIVVKKDSEIDIYLKSLPKGEKTAFIIQAILEKINK